MVHRGGLRQEGLHEGGVAGDGVHDLAEGAVRPGLALADQVTAGLPFLQSRAHRVPSIGARADEAGDRHLQAALMGADVSEEDVLTELSSDAVITPATP